MSLITDLTYLRAVEVLDLFVKNDMTAIRSKDMTRAQRECLLRFGLIAEVVKGWYIDTRSLGGIQPSEPIKKSLWYDKFWLFVKDYLNARFGSQWCLSPENSIRLLTGDWTIPNQLQVRTPAGGNKPLQLPCDTAILDLRLKLPSSDDQLLLNDLRVFTLPAALVNAAPTFYTQEPILMRAALGSLNDCSDVVIRLLEGEHSTIAGRLAGGLRFVGQIDAANHISQVMRNAGYTVHETNPFKGSQVLQISTNERSPEVLQMHMMWQKMRLSVIARFPELPRDSHQRDLSSQVVEQQRLEDIERAYVNDALQSLQMANFKVDSITVIRTMRKNWDRDVTCLDLIDRNALTAQGYREAYDLIRVSIRRILNGENPGEVLRTEHSQWHAALFSPNVKAGLLEPKDFEGYRIGSARTRDSAYIPPSSEVLKECVQALFDLIRDEQHPVARAVLGHCLFITIHPYTQASGVIARLLMNVLLITSNYDWITIPAARREDYFVALELATVQKDIVPFTLFLAELLPSVYGTRIAA